MMTNEDKVKTDHGVSDNKDGNVWMFVADHVDVLNNVFAVRVEI